MALLWVATCYYTTAPAAVITNAKYNAYILVQKLLHSTTTSVHSLLYSSAHWQWTEHCFWYNSPGLPCQSIQTNNILSLPCALTEHIVIYQLYAQHKGPLIAVTQDDTWQHNLKHNTKLTTITSKHMKHKFHLHQSCCIERGWKRTSTTHISAPQADGKGSLHSCFIQNGRQGR